MFGQIGKTLVLGLPGNPVSAFVCAYVFVAPLIERLLDAQTPLVSSRRVRAAAPIGRNGPRQAYLRGRLTRDSSGDELAEPFDAQDSSMMRLLAAADCLIIRPPNADEIPSGHAVNILDLRDM
jgi:molybdopterin molybdotransferase